LKKSPELEGVLDQLIEGYTQEAGVRELQRRISALCRASALAHCLKGGTPGVSPKFDITRFAGSLNEALGPPPPESSRFLRRAPTPDVSGIAPLTRKSAVLGLAWSPRGGELLRLEGTLQPGSGKITLTGNLGDILRESVQVALTLARATLAARSLGISRPGAPLENQDLHIHAPMGATPKDGPSAGVPLFCLILSLLGDFSLPEDEAYSGELGLLGDILPVGGLEQKLQAARRHGIRQVYFPAANREHLLGTLEPEALRDVQLHWVASIHELSARLTARGPFETLATLERRIV
jgi:ATP-dependent Lon protease